MSENTSETMSTSGKWTPLSAGVALALVVATGLMVLSLIGFKPEGPDAWTYDWRTSLFSQQAKAQRSDVAIIYVGEESMADYDYISPVDRGLIARVVQALNKAKVKAIGLDFIFDRKTEAGKTRQLLEAIRQSRVPVAIGLLDKRAKGFGPESFRNQDRFVSEAGPNVKLGHVYFLGEAEKIKIADQAIRYLVGPSPESPNLLALSAVLANVSGEKKEPSSSYIAWQLPPDNGDLFATFSVPRHSPGAGMDEIIPPSWYKLLEGKTVLVGGNFVDRDRHLTPLAVLDGKKVPGVDIQAQILAQRLDNRAIHDLPWYVEFAVLAIACFLGFLISLQYQSKKLDFVLYVGGIAVFVVAGIALFAVMSTILPTTLLLLSWTAGVTGAHYTKDILQRFKVVVKSPGKLLKSTSEHSTQQT